VIYSICSWQIATDNEQLEKVWKSDLWI